MEKLPLPLTLLKQASGQIKQLRQSNQVMSARLNMFDDVMNLFNSGRRGGDMCCGPDLTGQIDSLVDTEERRIEAAGIEKEQKLAAARVKASTRKRSK